MVNVPPRTMANTVSRSEAFKLYCVRAIIDFSSANFHCADAILRYVLRSITHGLRPFEDLP